jgi:hypothetical protein
MTAHIIGYARVSTNEQDLTAQRNGLASLGVFADRIYVDHGLTGRNKERPGLNEASPPSGPATPSSSPNSTGSPAPCRTRGTSSKTSPNGT